VLVKRFWLFPDLHSLMVLEQVRDCHYCSYCWFYCYSFKFYPSILHLPSFSVLICKSFFDFKKKFWTCSGFPNCKHGNISILISVIIVASFQFLEFINNPNFRATNIYIFKKHSWSEYAGASIILMSSWFQYFCQILSRQCPIYRPLRLAQESSS